MIDRVREGDLADLLPLMRAYCDFYEVAPSDEGLLGLSRALLADPLSEGVQLLARDAAGAAVGFATIFWTWSTLNAARLAVMNDLFVAPGARGTGTADALIEACRAEARTHGAVWLGWQTAKDNARAQTVYDRVGAERSEWIDYGLRP
ncbi:MAG: family N-acetyltransferase [Solirubrobacterales bacterium]|nr:family N-acetyltransferase [Solirubrobacterales bacterium]